MWEEEIQEKLKKWAVSVYWIKSGTHQQISSEIESSSTLKMFCILTSFCVKKEAGVFQIQLKNEFILEH